MTSVSDREKIVKLVNTARATGARLSKACEVLSISSRTIQRWTKGGIVRKDCRPIAKRKPPANKQQTE